MDTKKWEALLTAVEAGSFTKAAERLGYTQSGLTHMMHALEREVGIPLPTKLLLCGICSLCISWTEG